ncbi:MAG TPA: hypothetical protein VLF79_00300 [Candidatus Saccharimonadales bacterium]|nr:hypothetical protein [Candidatus Saccharimonadales bacterium]
MDYLDLNKQFRQRITLLVGYVLIAVAISTGTIILLYQAYGFGLGKNGAVIQNELTFFSSHPNPANIYANNQRQPVTTNTRLTLPSGIYHFKLTRTGYHDWQRNIELQGGGVVHFDYPFLFPVSLTTDKLQTLTGEPGLASQSPDRRWWVVEQPGSMTDFAVYDLKNSAKPATALTLPANLLTKPSTNENWQLVEWADDNRHVLLQHNFDGKNEFILLDRITPDLSINLNRTLVSETGQLTLKNKKYNGYYLFDSATKTLQTATLGAPTLLPVQQRVLAYKSYGNNTVLYVTDSGAPADKVLVKLRVGNKIYPIRTLPVGNIFLVDLTEYSGTLYVAAGDNSDNKVYIFKDPVGQLTAQPNQAVVPVQVLHVPAPNYLSFSNNTQFIVASNANRFGVYDAENELGYNYTVQKTLDAPQQHATWMDGDRLIMTSGGKLVVFDYDGTNVQTLMPAHSAYIPAFAPDFKSVFSLVASPTAGQLDLTQTYLLTAADR